MPPQKKTTPTSKPNKNYSLIRDIRSDNRYKNNVPRRDKEARKVIENKNKTSGPAKAIPGQMLYFDYYTPKTEEELEYYDAQPVTIFFGRFNTKDGLRIMGFNLHYYPPRIRYQVMDRIFEIWKPMYLKEWGTGLSKQNNHFDYSWLKDQLEKAGLGFGVRMYIPELMVNIRVVPPEDWRTAAFTEGVFKKRTRDAILNYWKNYRKKH